MVSVLIHQDTSSVPLMTTPIIDLTTMQSDSPLPKSTTTTSIITKTTTIPPTPQPQQSTTDPILVCRIGELEQHMADLLEDNLALGERLDKHGTRLYNLENLDIPHKVSQAVDEIVTDAVDWAMQAPLQARFRDLPTKSLELDYSNQRLTDQEEARKKRRKRRDTPRSPLGSPPSQPPPLHPLACASGAPGTSGASGSSQLKPPSPPPSTGISGSTPYESTGIAGAQELSPSDDLMHDDSAPDEQVQVSDDQDSENDHPPAAGDSRKASQSMAWTTSDTRYESADVSRAQELYPTDSLMQNDSIPGEQVHLSDDEDSGNDHLPKADSRKDWWKPLPEEERPVTPEPAWIIPSSNVSAIENNWASALVSTYEPPAENSLLAKTGDMTTFMNWYCRQVNKTELTQADFEGQAYEVVKAFYPDVIHLQFQMEECHKMLTDQVDWTNPEGEQVRVDVNRPLPLGGPPGHVTIQP
ncbi:hypothetical protein Tco_0608339 [Tanacetum coccineum]